MKTLVFLQARMGSTRFPEKVLMKISGKSIVEHAVNRLSKINDLDGIVLVTSTNPENDDLEQEAKGLGIEFFRGSEENLLDRHYQASKKYNPDVIIRVTADCPLIDPKLINTGLDIFQKEDYDIVSNVKIRSYPDGVDFEIFRKSALEKSWQNMFGHLESVPQDFYSPTKYIHQTSGFKRYDMVSDTNFAHVRLTLDYMEDFDVIKAIFDHFGDRDSDTYDMVTYLENHPDIAKLNEKYVCLDYGLGS